MGDSDDTYDFADLSALIEPLEHGADMVVGNRFAGGISRGRHAVGASVHRQPDHQLRDPALLRHADRRQPERPARVHAHGLRAARAALGRDGARLGDDRERLAGRACRSPRCPRHTTSGWARASSTRSATAGATCASCSSPHPNFLFTLPGPGDGRAWASSDGRALVRGPGRRGDRLAQLAAGLRGHDPAGDRRQLGSSFGAIAKLYGGQPRDSQRGPLGPPLPARSSTWSGSSRSAAPAASRGS